MPANYALHIVDTTGAGGVEDAFVPAKTDYAPGDEFIQPRVPDGVPFLFQVPAGYVGPAGAVWDAAEQARYTAIGDVPATPHTPLGALATPLATTAATTAEVAAALAAIPAPTPHTPLGALATPAATDAATTAEVAAALAALPPPRSFATAAEALAGTEAAKVIAPDVLKAELDRRELALDFDKYIAASTVAAWNDATLAIAQLNHFYRFSDSGTVAMLLGVANVEVQRGDVVRATVDGTVAASVADWQLIPVSPAAVPDEGILDTTDGMTLEWGKEYWFHPAFNYTFPAVTQTANDNWMRGYPSNFDWRAFTGTWTGNGTDTIGAGQEPLAALSDAVTFIGSLGTPNNISMHVGGGSAAEVGLPAYVNLADAQGAGIAGRLFRGLGTGDLTEGAYYMQANNIPVGPIS